MSTDDLALFAQKYYLPLAAAFVRGKLGHLSTTNDAEAVQQGLQSGLRLHKFKRSNELPRVKKVLGVLHGLNPETLLDVGSGRGVFLWPLLDQFPHLAVQTIDVRVDRVEDMQAVSQGGIRHLSADVMDVNRMEFADNSHDIVTALEVLEHLPKPEQAAREIVRVARRFVIVSVPSKVDDNPEHIQLFDADSLTALLTEAGARRVRAEYVLNHIVAVAGASG